MPIFSPSGNQVASTTSDVMIAVPRLTPTRSASPCWKTVHGSTPRLAWTIPGAPHAGGPEARLRRIRDMAEFTQGDRVSWNTSQGRTQGKVVRRLTSDRNVEGHEVKAS